MVFVESAILSGILLINITICDRLHDINIENVSSKYEAENLIKLFLYKERYSSSIFELP